MSDWRQRGSHPEMALYYYDFAMDSDAEVPESVSSHIRRCVSCRRQIRRLKAAVLGVRNRMGRQRSPMNRVIDTLDSHFRCLEEPVTCVRVRPFLPGLLQSSRQLRIPTPITVHVDQCPRCAEDLELLRKLALDGERLERLRRLYEQKPSRSLLLCWRARSSIAAFSRGALEGVDPAVSSHLAICPRCRAEVYARRQAILSARSAVAEDRWDGAAPADLLDYVIPPRDVTHQAARSENAHGGVCPKCLEAIQALHRTIYGVLDRPESGVTTVYRTIGDSETVVASPGDPYAEYPIRVQVIRREPQQAAALCPAASDGRTGAPRETVNPHVRRLLKTAIAAAAVIPLAALFLYTQGTSGVTLAKVFRAFGQAKNVRVMGLHPDADQVSYELWVARDLQLAGLMRADGCVVYDLAGKKKADPDSGQIAAMDDVEHARITQMANSCLGFALTDIPPDAAWTRVDSDGDREVYELAWTQRTDRGRGVPFKSEVTINGNTMLPESWRTFRWDALTAEWKCTSCVILEYPSETEMASVMRGKSPDGTRRR